MGGGGGGFFLQAEDGIRDLGRSRGLGDVYKRQTYGGGAQFASSANVTGSTFASNTADAGGGAYFNLALIHI